MSSTGEHPSSHDAGSRDGSSPDAVADGREAVAAALCMEPGLEAMALLQSIDVAGMDVAARVDVATAWERQQAWVAAQTQEALAAVSADVAALPVAEQVRALEHRQALISAACNWSPGSAGRRLFIAEQLVGQLADTHALLAAGEISFRHAWVLADAVTDLEPDEAAFVQARVLEHAPTLTVAAFTRLVRRAVIAAAPELAAARREQAKRGRTVICRSLPDGMAELIATMAAEDAETVFSALAAVAEKASAQAKEADPAAPALPIGAYRADALLGWAQQALAEPDLPRRQGRRVEVQVVIDLPTLLGLVDRPAELAGYGPIPAPVARELAADAAWRRLVVDPVDGHLLDYGTQVYRPPQKLVDYLVARDRRCRFPGCSMRAAACDLDHVIPFGKPGGITASSNLAALCRRHHRLKTHGGWRLELHKDGSLTWTSPSGREFDVDPYGQLDEHF